MMKELLNAFYGQRFEHLQFYRLLFISETFVIAKFYNSLTKSDQWILVNE